MTRRRFQTPTLGGAKAMVLHRPHATVQAVTRQLLAIGLSVSECWPDAGPAVLGADFLFFDADLCHDAQFTWAAGAAPMPMIALIGSEAPGRIEWALSQGADAQLLKPVGAGGVFSALLIAWQAFEARRSLAAEIADLRARLGERQTVVMAVIRLAAAGRTEAEAYAHLRELAMARQETIEQAAHRIVASAPDLNRGRNDRHNGS
jgi:two-component system, response regulator / RNA-binding antiterminator